MIEGTRRGICRCRDTECRLFLLAHGSRHGVQYGVYMVGGSGFRSSGDIKGGSHGWNFVDNILNACGHDNISFQLT